MGRTIAEKLRDDGRKEERKKGEVRVRCQVLLELLQERFGALPAETVAVIKATRSSRELDAWLRRVVKAATLEEIGIGN